MLQIRFCAMNTWFRSTDQRQAMFLIGFLLNTLGSSLTNIALAYQYLLRPVGVEQYAILMYGATLTAIIGASYLGSQADRLGRYDRSLLALNLSSAIASAALACSPPFWVVVVLVVTSTALTLWNAIIVRKLLPEFFTGDKLRRVTAWLTEIAAIGAVIGPLLGPLFPMFGVDLSTMFVIDALTFTATGFIYWRCFKFANGPKEVEISQPYRGVFTAIRDSFRLVRDRNLRPLILTYLPFSLGLSSLFFTLALFNKRVADGDEMAYTVPIIAMFCGRTFASKFAGSRHYSFGYPGFFAAGACIAFVSLLLIPLNLTLGAFASLQFFLGIGLSMAIFAHAMWLQMECNKDRLGLATGTFRMIDACTKLVGIPLITALASNELLWVAAVTVGSCFGLGSLSVFRRFSSIERSAIPIGIKNSD